jgi:cation transport regulator ChaC
MQARLEVRPGEVGLFGYGSLLLLSSMERTLGRAYPGERRVCHLRGWRRTWDSIYPNQRYYFLDAGGERCYPKNILYLNATSGDDLLNGVVYTIPEDELAGFDKREAVYQRVDVRKDLTDLEVTSGPVWMYVGMPPYVLSGVASREEAAIRRTYVGIVEAGLDELGAEFRQGYHSSSDPVPEMNVVDDVME